jgi:hypothetical protein
MAQHARLGEESPLRHLDPLTVRNMIIEGIHAIHTPGVIALMTPDELRRRVTPSPLLYYRIDSVASTLCF